MIGSLSGRRSFDRLRACGVRRQKGPITVISRACPAQQPRVAFAVSRGVGGAVQRNRAKRRIRHVVGKLIACHGSALGGDHLIRIHAPIGHWDHPRLVSAMSDLFGPAPAGAEPAVAAPASPDLSSAQLPSAQPAAGKSPAELCENRP